MRNLFTISAFLHFLSSLHSSVTASESIDNSLLWGPYRPNLYFGMRARVPKSLSFGLMWTSVVDNQLDLKKLRHACEPSDRMAKYGWSMYDVRTGGIQNIFDPGNNLNLTTQLVKMQDDSGKGSWGVRVQGRFRDASIPRNASVIWYITVENDAQSGSNALNCQKSPWSPEIECQGNSFVLSSFNIQLPWGMTKNIPTTNLYGFKFPDEELWKAKGKLNLLSSGTGLN